MAELSRVSKVTGAEKRALQRWKVCARNAPAGGLEGKRARWWLLPPDRREVWLQRGVEAAVEGDQVCIVAWLLDRWTEHHADLGLSKYYSAGVIHQCVVSMVGLAAEAKSPRIVHTYLAKLTPEEMFPQVHAHLEMLLHARYGHMGCVIPRPQPPYHQEHFNAVMLAVKTVPQRLEGGSSALLLKVAATFSPSAIDLALVVGGADLMGALNLALSACTREVPFPPAPHASVPHLLKLLKVGPPDFPETPCWLFARRHHHELNDRCREVLYRLDGVAIPPTLQLLKQRILRIAYKPSLAAVNGPSGPNGSTGFTGLTGATGATGGPGFTACQESIAEMTGILRDMAAEWWALVALSADGMIRVTPRPRLSFFAADTRRFLDIARKLPHDLQIILCLRVINLSGVMIPGGDLKRATIAVIVEFFVI